MKTIGENVVRIEAEALRALADRIAGPMAKAFAEAAELLHGCKGRVVVTGMGKSGIIARKIAATLNSTGTPALFMHPVEAVHGDLGMVVRGDVVLALSASGETEEILRLLATLKRLQVPLIAMTCDEIAWQEQECPRTFRLWPRLPMLRWIVRSLKKLARWDWRRPLPRRPCLALGDALAMTLSEKRGFKEEDFANLHPGGKLGKRLARVESLMHSGDAVPHVTPKTKMPDVIYEMSRKKLGMTAVVEGKKLLGVISDGDLRRLLEKRGKDALDLTAGQCMTKNPKTIAADEFAATALALMEEKKITSLAVVDGKGKLEGIVHLHDLWGTEMM